MHTRPGTAYGLKTTQVTDGFHAPVAFQRIILQFLYGTPEPIALLVTRPSRGSVDGFSTSAEYRFRALHAV